jgi:tetratricopeptide (TPR) repeat protein
VLSTSSLGNASPLGEVLSAALNQSVEGKDRALIPIRIEECEPGALLSPVVPINLTGLDEREATQAVLNGIRAMAPAVSSFPGRAATSGAKATLSTARFPATGPAVWELRSHRPDPHFVGRDELLTALHQRLKSGGATALVQAITGLGGIGKTRAAIEYAHRYARVYDVVWWIRAERPETLLSDYAGLAADFSLPHMAQQEMAIAAVRQELRRRENWLLIFDNADDPSAITNLLPDRHSGSVVVTTRRREWPHSDNLPVEVLDEQAAREYLRQRAGVTDDQVADSLANALGLLPLALAQAAAVIADGMGAGEYLKLIESRAPELFEQGRPIDSETTVSTTWRVSFEQLASHPGAVALQQLSSFFAPDALPVTILRPADELPDALVHVLTDPMARVAATRELARYSLADPAGGELSTHRLVQLIVRTQLRDQEDAWARYTLIVAVNTFPAEPEQPSSWPAADQFLPHAIAAAAHASRLGIDPANRSVLLDRTSRYLSARGRIGEAAGLAKQATTVADFIGAEHPATLAALHSYGKALRAQGHLREARTVLENVYTSRIRVLGGDDPATLATARELIATRHALGDLAGSRKVDDQTLPLHSAVLGAHHPDSLTALAYHARLLYGEGRYRDARVIEERLIDRRRELLGADHPDTLTSINNLARTLSELGDLQQARELQQQVLDRRRGLLGADHPDTLTSISNLAVTLRELGELQQARELQQQVLDRRQQLLGADHPDTLTSAGNLAGTLSELGELQQARELHQQVLDRCQQLWGADHPDTLASRNNLASTLSRLGELRRARELHQQVIDRCQELLGADHPNTLTSINNLAGTLSELGELQQARELQQQVLDRRRELLGADHPDTLTSISNLASTLSRLGELQQARELQEQVLDRRQQLLGADHRDTLTSISNLAVTLSELGELQQGRELQQQVLDRCRELLGADHPDTLTSMNHLGSTLISSGDLSGARALFTQSLEFSRRKLGERHPRTSESAWHAYQIEMARGNAPAARNIVVRHLAWLRTARVDQLSLNQRTIKRELGRGRPPGR